jgi:hypothetical protein
VIRKGFLLPHDAEVPLDLLEPGPQDAVHVPYTADQIHTLPRFEPGDYTPLPPQNVPPVGYPAGTLHQAARIFSTIVAVCPRAARYGLIVSLITAAKAMTYRSGMYGADPAWLVWFFLAPVCRRTILNRCTAY